MMLLETAVIMTGTIKGIKIIAMMLRMDLLTTTFISLEAKV